jgi:TPR repeat protein
LNEDTPGQSADYLLEEDGSSGGVIRKLVLVTLLAVIAGSAFVYWRSSLRAALKPYIPVKTQPAAAPAPSPESGANDAASSSSTQPASASTSDAAAAPESTPAATAASAAADKQPGPAPPDAAKSTGPATETTEPAAGARDKDKTATARPKQKAAEDTQPKPSAELLKAQQLLQGRGVSQNCEQGLVYLRAAAQKNEPAAAVQMSSLYATGHCVQQDRVMAYRWLNSAHELAPSNASIQTSMDVLWGQMTSQERRQAGR